MSSDSTQNKPHESVIDVTVERIARVYAQALLGATAEGGRAGAVVDELEALVADALDPNPRLEHTLASALLAPEEKAGLLERIFSGRVSTDVLNFLKVLAAHGRLDILRSVVREVHKLYSEQVGRSNVEVTVAVELDETLRSQLAQTLKNQLGKEPVFHVRVDPSLLAGLVVRIGDTVYDSSVKTSLEKARQAMVARAVETIESKPEKFFD